MATKIYEILFEHDRGCEIDSFTNLRFSVRRRSEMVVKYSDFTDTAADDGDGHERFFPSLST